MPAERRPNVATDDGSNHTAIDHESGFERRLEQPGLGDQRDNLVAGPDVIRRRLDRDENEICREAYAALLFEHVDVAATLASLKRHCRPGGMLATVVQLPHRDHKVISPSPYKILALLAPVMRLIEPADLSRLAAAAGFCAVDSESIELSSGKRFSLQTFQA